LVNILTNGSLTSDDLQGNSIKQCLAKISAFLKEDFHQFMPSLLEMLIADSKVDIDIKLESADLSTTGGEGEASYTFKMKGVEGYDGTQRIKMNTDALQSKIGAYDLLA
jgi:hypothetical protein